MINEISNFPPATAISTRKSFNHFLVEIAVVGGTLFPITALLNEKTLKNQLKRHFFLKLTTS
jgi:hypothetical protein